MQIVARFNLEDDLDDDQLFEALKRGITEITNELQEHGTSSLKNPQYEDLYLKGKGGIVGSVRWAEK